MCLAIPSKITKIDNEMAVIDVDGVTRQASLLLLEDAKVGEYVIVHAGFAIQKIDEQAAAETLSLLREAAAASDKAGITPKKPEGIDEW
ncbi:MAG: HypC/HybG/HupF family hydrogenase formation chaperone [Desulfobacteraceae bacterium]|nr:HypC/HybG/HupF family hydrogenase formation chaperone [Desulfobacteraceae bacterium]